MKQSFQDRVLEAVSRIPRGTVLTYKEVAQRAGSPGAYRAVGSIMKQNRRKDVPCHRVVKSDLSLGEYNRGGTREKRRLLQKEGALDDEGKPQRFMVHGAYVPFDALAGAISRGGIGVIPSDTIYGLMTPAKNKRAIEEVYRIRRLSPDKPFIILIQDIQELQDFGILITGRQGRFLHKVWPGPVSVILPCRPNKKLSYLHRGANTLAFRVPDSGQLLAFLKKTGPLIAPSVNPEGQKPAHTIEEARKYFGGKVNIYWDQGRRTGKPSTLIKFENDDIVVVRSGTVSLRVLQKVYREI